LGFVDEVWPADNTDPFARLTVQNVSTYAYSPQIITAWVTDSPHWLTNRATSLFYRILSSMQGSLGIGSDISRWTLEEIALRKRLIAAYHLLQSTIVLGELHRLIPPRNGSEFSARQTVRHDKSKSVVLTFSLLSRGALVSSAQNAGPRSRRTL
jgi:alpha-galactosidase